MQTEQPPPYVAEEVQPANENTGVTPASSPKITSTETYAVERDPSAASPSPLVLEEKQNIGKRVLGGWCAFKERKAARRAMKWHLWGCKDPQCWCRDVRTEWYQARAGACGTRRDGCCGRRC